MVSPTIVIFARTRPKRVEGDDEYHDLSHLPLGMGPAYSCGFGPPEKKRMTTTTSPDPRMMARPPGAKGSTAVIVGVAAVGSIFLIGILAAIALPAYQDYTKRAKVSEGIRMGDALRVRIAEAYEQRAPDLSCGPEACRLYGAAPASTKYVKRLSSDRTGAILIEYDEHLFPGAKNRLSITPLVDARPADLSDPANAGKSLTWKCGQDALTTVATRYLPSSCR